VARLRVELTTARALAFEEVTRALSHAAIKDGGVLWAIQTVRALAPLPPTLKALPVEVVEQVCCALLPCSCHPDNDCWLECCELKQNQVRAALAALERVT
jgi:hypothetical protein